MTLELAVGVCVALLLRGPPPALLIGALLCARQDKVKGSEEEKAAAAKKFADINHGAALASLWPATHAAPPAPR